jgi:hypothetical protein
MTDFPQQGIEGGEARADELPISEIVNKLKRTPPGIAHPGCELARRRHESRPPSTRVMLLLRSAQVERFS